ncbi:Alpha/Beta hydrolase protein [Trichoderma barbatum]
MNSAMRYAELPSSANKEAIKAFELAIPEAELTRMNTLLKLSNIASANYENTQAQKSNEFGLSREWLVAAKDRWETSFDWRKREELVNSYPNFKTVSSDESSTINIHFTALFSSKPDAIPIVLLHGWPGSFFEFLPMLKLLKEKYPDEASLPYHIIVPSLPGYGLSDPPPSDRNFTVKDASRVIDHLMSNTLGFTSYVAQGGDVGAGVARILGATHQNCKAVHLNFNLAPPPHDTSTDGLDEKDLAGLKRSEWFSTTAVAYAVMHATRPATSGLVIMSNPLALLVWIGEKFLDWTDPASFPHSPKHPYSIELMDEAIAGASLYYLAGCAHTGLYPYREYLPKVNNDAARVYSSMDMHVSAPKILGYSSFPNELVITPKKWVALGGNLVYFKRHDKGGHFAALEQPAVLLEDVEEFVQMLAAES